MGISVETMFFDGPSCASVDTVVANVMTDRERERIENRKADHPIGPPLNHPEGRKARYFAIGRFGRSCVALMEAGGTWEPTLAQDISKRLDERVLFFCLHEGTNSWGYAEYRSGELTDHAFCPVEYYSVIVPWANRIHGWTGDASEEAFQFLERRGLPLLDTYDHIAGNSAQPSPDEIRFVCYRKKD